MCETISLGHCLAPKLATFEYHIPQSVAAEAYRMAVSLIQFDMTPTRESFVAILAHGFWPCNQGSPQSKALIASACRRDHLFLHSTPPGEREDNTFTRNNLVRRVFIIFHYVNRRSFVCWTSRSIHNEMLILVHSVLRYLRLSDLLFWCWMRV